MGLFSDKAKSGTEIAVNSQSKFHRWMGVETSEGNQRNLRWERGENKSIITHIQHKEGKKAHSNKPEKEVSQT